ncbi:MAG TPA: hypothetical protein VFV38_52555 [Ktedonobacteraceae bacterium]|nr:hypothetical protein [Ktedonobacteraceae bacterium]
MQHILAKVPQSIFSGYPQRISARLCEDRSAMKVVTWYEATGKDSDDTGYRARLSCAI